MTAFSKNFNKSGACFYIRYILLYPPSKLLLQNSYKTLTKPENPNEKV